MGVNGQRHSSAALYPRERTSDTHWIGGSVDLRAGLDTGYRKNPLSVGDRTPIFKSVVRHYNDRPSQAPTLRYIITLYLNINNINRGNEKSSRLKEKENVLCKLRLCILF
jgi:hypothetical protein